MNVIVTTKIVYKGGLSSHELSDFQAELEPPIYKCTSNCYDVISGMMQARIDRMDELGQMVVKTSAILGMSFSRRMLDTLLPKKITASTVQRCMREIGDEQIFGCALVAEKQPQHSGTVQQRGAQFECACPGTAVSTMREKTINDCQTLCFKSSTLQETAYEMYTESLRRKIHIKAARYLESQAHKCNACGGGDFMPSALSPPSQEMPPEDIATLEVRARSARSGSASSSVKSPISKLRKASLMVDTAATAEATKSHSQQGTGLPNLPENEEHGSNPDIRSANYCKCNFFTTYLP